MPTQRLAVGTSEGAIIMYDLKTGTRLYVLEAHKKRPAACSFSPDGRRLVSVGLEEGVVLVWKVCRPFLITFLSLFLYHFHFPALERREWGWRSVLGRVVMLTTGLTGYRSEAAFRVSSCRAHRQDRDIRGASRIRVWRSTLGRKVRLDSTLPPSLCFFLFATLHSISLSLPLFPQGLSPFSLSFLLCGCRSFYRH